MFIALMPKERVTLSLPPAKAGCQYEIASVPTPDGVAHPITVKSGRRKLVTILPLQRLMFLRRRGHLWEVK